MTTDNGNIAPTNANLACSDSYATWTNTAGSQENLPINCVNWCEAYAFCIWDGGFLPSEAEWEYAAAGGSSAARVPVGLDRSGDWQSVCNLRLLLPRRDWALQWGAKHRAGGNGDAGSGTLGPARHGWRGV